MLDQPHLNGATSQSDSHAHIRLACQACQRKKIKCDRTFPCGQCLKSNLECIASSRKQRARHAGKRAVDGELRSRIAKLESLVDSLSGDGSGSAERALSDDASVSSPRRTDSVDLDSPRIGKYVASHFWSSLSTEMAALKEALEEEDEDDGPHNDIPDTQLTSPRKNEPSLGLEHDLILCPPGKVYIMPGAMEEPSTHVKQQLQHYFGTNVERLMKLFHTSTVMAALEEDAPYLGHQPDTPVHNALKRVAWFAGLNSLAESRVLELTGQSKSDLLPRYRRYCEISLAQADVINTSDIASLQCFLLFITICRSADTSRRTWTLLALVVRLATAMHLNHEDPRATPYMRELRRRLWHYVGFLDKFCALDRGTIPLIEESDHTVPLPACTDDALFGPDSTSIPIVTDRLCDMSFAIMCMEACGTIEALLMPGHKNELTWDQRYQLALDLGKHTESAYLVHCNLQDPFQRLYYGIGRSMSASMLLRAVRPMQRHIASVPPPVNSPYVLQLATDNLRESAKIFGQTDLAAWQWMKWVPWHSLACALAGLCFIRDTELANQAWTAVEPAYAFYAQHVADGQDGMLWRPIVKLYKKATVFRDASTVKVVTNHAVTASVIKGEDMSFQSSECARQLPLPTTNMLQPASDLDPLSSNFSSMSPFGTTNTFRPGPQNQANTASLSTGFLYGTPFSNGDWGDWGQLMDAYADPMSIDDTAFDPLVVETMPWDSSGVTGFGLL